MTLSLSEILDTVKMFITNDLSLIKPTLTASIFSAKELFDSIPLEFETGLAKEVMRTLTMMHVVTPTNKISESGEYFNVHYVYFLQHHASNSRKSFINNMKKPEAGYCFIITNNKTYSQECEGRKCKYFLGSEKECVLGKFFAN